MSGSESLIKAQRLQIIFKRLEDAPAAATFEEALAQVIAIMNAVENEYTAIPYNPAKGFLTNERMYPPELEGMRDVEGIPSLKLYRHARHDTVIGSNGSLEMRIRKTGQVVFAKPGADGKGVQEL